MRVLITGAGGFIGSHLTRSLLEEDNKVLALDNFNDYYSPAYKYQRFNALTKDSSHLELVEIDLCDKETLGRLFKSFKPDSVIHLAGQAGVRLPESSHHKYIDSNIVGFTNILSETVNQRISSFMYASSSSVYGNSIEFPLSEKQTNLNPISFYGSTKLSNEFLAEKISLNTGTTTLGLRFFSVYGPWGRPDMAYFKILQALMTDQKFQMFGTGELLRDMTHVFDVIKSISLLQDCIQMGATSVPKVTNIGGGRPHSLIKLISVLEGISGKKLKIDHQPSSKLDVNRTEASFSRLQNLIAYRPLIDIEEGAKNLLEWAESPEILSILREGKLL